MKQILFVLIFSIVCFARTKVEDIQTFTLENGMKVIVWKPLNPERKYVFVLESWFTE